MERKISQENLKTNFQQYRSSLYHSGHGTLYKNCRESPNCPEFLDERISFVNTLSQKNGYTHPISILKDDSRIYGYEMPFLEGYSTFWQLINMPDRVFQSKLPFKDKKEILSRVHQTLKSLNKDFIVGDINLRNLMLSKDGTPMIIDWENGAPKNSNLPLLVSYQTGISRTELQEDAIKAFVASISLLYGIDFEKFVFSNSFYDLLTIDFAQPIKEYISQTVIDAMEYTPSPTYFDELLKSVKEPSFLALQRVRRQVNKIQQNNK